MTGAIDEREDALEHLKRLVRAGAGWQAYALGRAEQLQNEAPALFSGLRSNLQAFINELARAARAKGNP
jgi:hypothetical protein